MSKSIECSLALTVLSLSFFAFSSQIFSVYAQGTQYALPDADISNSGGWTSTPLWSKICETPYSDTDFIKVNQQNPSSTDTCVVSLSDVTDPASSSDHVMRIRVKRQGGNNNDKMNLELRQDYVSEASLGTLIASITDISLSPSYQTFTHTLSGAEADSITDYSSLYYRVIPQMPSLHNNPAGFVSWAEFEVPDATFTITITITSNPTGSGFVKVDNAYISTPHIFAWEVGSNHALEALSPVNGGTGIQYIFESWDDAGAQTHTYTTPSFDETVTATYQTEYYLTAVSSYGNPIPSSWVNQGSDYGTSVTSPDSGYECNGYRIDGGALQTGTSHTFTNVQAPHRIEYFWSTPPNQYFLNVSSQYGKVSGEGWYDEGSTAEFSVSPEFITEDAVRYTFIGWIDDYIGGANPYSIIIDESKTVTAQWQTRYFINVISPNGSATPSGWPLKGESYETNVATPDANHTCIGYKVDNGSIQLGISCTFENIQTNHTIEYLWTADTPSEEHKFLIVQLDVAPLEIDVTYGPVKVTVKANVTTNDGTGEHFMYIWKVSDGDLNFEQNNPIETDTVKWTLSEEGSQKITCTVSCTGYGDKEASASIEALPEFHHTYMMLLFSLSIVLFIFIRKKSTSLSSYT